MKVHVWVHHKKGNTHSQGYQRDDIVMILPIQPIFEAQQQKTMIPIVVDLNIPCPPPMTFTYKYVSKKDHWVKDFDCKSCPNNDPDLCDFQLYARAQWDPGGVEQQPTLISKSRFKIKLLTQLPKSVRDYAFKTDDKTRQEELDMLNWSNTLSNHKNKSIVDDKEPG
jgi:hypothetical protein